MSAHFPTGATPPPLPAKRGINPAQASFICSGAGALVAFVPFFGWILASMLLGCGVILAIAAMYKDQVAQGIAAFLCNGLAGGLAAVMAFTGLFTAVVGGAAVATSSSAPPQQRAIPPSPKPLLMPLPTPVHRTFSSHPTPTPLAPARSTQQSGITTSTDTQITYTLGSGISGDNSNSSSAPGFGVNVRTQTTRPDRTKYPYMGTLIRSVQLPREPGQTQSLHYPAGSLVKVLAPGKIVSGDNMPLPIGEADVRK